VETLGQILLGIWIVFLVVVIVAIAGAFLLVAGLMMLPFIIIASVFL